MDKVEGSMEVLSSLQLTKDKTETMDIRSKNLLRNKEVLAVILGEVITEYKGYSREEIMSFIETESITDQTEVSPGRTNTRVLGDSAEFAALNEKVSYFDLVFRAKNPVLSTKNLLVSLHMDIEPQTTYHPGYPIEKRGMYYLARRLSFQLSLVTKRTDYSQLEKCYCIFICRDDIPEKRKYSLSVYEVTNTKETSLIPVRKKNYDLMTLIVIKLGDRVYNGKKEDEGYDLLRFLNAVIYPQEGKTAEIVGEYIDLPKNENLQEEVEHMSGLGESIFREGVEEGIERGIEQGIEKGIEKGIQELILDNLEEGISQEKILAKLQRRFDLSAEKAEEYFERFTFNEA